jgi:selenium metabolism protein YedF
MPENILNCEGLPCPQPVIRLKKLLDNSSPQEITLIVDNDPALENVSRFLTANGYKLSSTKDGTLWHVSAHKDGSASVLEDKSREQPRDVSMATGGTQEESKTLVMIISPVFGSGDDTLGTKLMKNFISTLPEMGAELWRIILLNGGVALSVADSPVLKDLQALEKNGVSILVCGTCLDYFSLLDQKMVGQTTNMLDVVTSMQLADKVIRI